MNEIIIIVIDKNMWVKSKQKLGLIDRRPMKRKKKLLRSCCFFEVESLIIWHHYNLKKSLLSFYNFSLNQRSKKYSILDISFTCMNTTKNRKSNECSLGKLKNHLAL